MLTLSLDQAFNKANQFIKQDDVGEAINEFIDTHSITKNKMGASNMNYMIDNIHLHPKIFNLIQSQI